MREKTHELSSFERIVSFFAAILTIIQFLFSISPFFGFEHYAVIINFGNTDLSIRVLIFIFAEIILAWGFSATLKYLSQFVDYEQPFGWLIFIVIVFISAWVTIINSQVIMVAKTGDYSLYEYVLFSISVISSGTVAIAMIIKHFEPTDFDGVIIAIAQGIAFAIMASTVQKVFYVTGTLALCIIILGILVFIQDNF